MVCIFTNRHKINPSKQPKLPTVQPYKKNKKWLVERVENNSTSQGEQETNVSFPNRLT